MLLPDDKDVMAWASYLGQLHDRDLPDLCLKDDLFEGTAPLCYLHPEILREVEDRIQVVALGWPMLAVEPLEERLDLLGFRYPEEGGEVDPGADPEELASVAGDENLQRVWQDNDLDEESQMGHLDALVMRRAYATVGVNDAADTDSPLVTVESPKEMFALIDPRTRQVRAALRRWSEDYDLLTQLPKQYATVYLPNMTVWLDRGPTGWRETGRDEHNLGTPPVAALTNRGRLANRYGKSELTPPLLSLSHAANKMATDMMVTGEFHMVPLRVFLGVGPEDFQDEQGNRRSALQVIMGRMLAVPGQEGVDGGGVKAHEFTASDLANFHNTMNQLGRHAAGLIGVDPSVLGMATGDNPASAEALKSRELRLIKKAERRQKAFGAGWERTMRIVRRFQEGDWDPKARRLEAIWRDAATPTRAQAADAAAKLVAANLIPVQQGREDLGYTPSQQRRMAALDKLNAERDPLGQLTQGFGRGMPVEPAQSGVPGDPGPVEE